MRPDVMKFSHSLLVIVSCTEEKDLCVFAVTRLSSCVAVVGLGGCVVLEVGVVAGGLGRDATGRVVDKHHLQQVESVSVEVLAEGLVVIASPLRKGGFEVWVAGHARPVILGRRSQNPIDGLSVGDRKSG